MNNQDNKQPQSSQQPAPLPYYADDEISLLDLWRTLMERKRLILATLAVVLLAATVYLIVTPSTYEAKVRLMLPKPYTLSISTPDHPFTEFDEKKVFDGFAGELKLTEAWRRFVAANPDLFDSKKQQDDISFIAEHPVKFAKDRNPSPVHVDVTYQDDHPGTAAEILRRYLQFSHNEYSKDLMDQIKNRIERQRETFTTDVNFMRQKAWLVRQDAINRLREDIALAKSLGITENLLLHSGEGQRGGDITIIATSETMRSYMRGTKVLGAELETLLNRESDDAHIAGLRDKQMELERLQALQLTPERFKPYSQDGAIFEPGSPIKPQKKLVLALSIVLGLMLGLFAAFFAEFLAKAREPELKGEEQE